MKIEHVMCWTLLPVVQGINIVFARFIKNKGVLEELYIGNVMFIVLQRPFILLFYPRLYVVLIQYF